MHTGGRRFEPCRVHTLNNMKRINESDTESIRASFYQTTAVPTVIDTWDNVHFHSAMYDALYENGRTLTKKEARDMIKTIEGEDWLWESSDESREKVRKEIQDESWWKQIHDFLEK